MNIMHDSIETMPPEEVKDMIKTALASGNHMIDLLNDILTKSKNKYLLNKTVRHTVHYKALANEACGSLKALASNMDLSFKHEIYPEDCDIVIATDRTKIIQFVSNIVNNALKFSCRGTILARTNLLPTLTEAISELERCAQTYDGFAFSMEEGKCTLVSAMSGITLKGFPSTSKAAKKRSNGCSCPWQILAAE